MKLNITAFFLALFVFVASPAEARKHRVVQPQIQEFDFFAQFQAPSPALRGPTANSPSRRRTVSDVTYLPHPAGCPRRLFCGCGAAIAVFGKNIRELWSTSQWFKFPRTEPASGMVAVRRGHVFVLRQHVKGDVWIVEDYNSGKGQSRIHERRIAGYSIRNPHA